MSDLFQNFMLVGVKNFRVGLRFVGPLEGVWQPFVPGRNLATKPLTVIAQNKT
jgi:hypothetical protein